MKSNVVKTVFVWRNLLEPNNHPRQGNIPDSQLAGQSQVGSNSYCDQNYKEAEIIVLLGHLCGFLAGCGGWWDLALPLAQQTEPAYIQLF